MNILVIGASSFVGAYEIEELSKYDEFKIVGTGRNIKFKEYYEGVNIPYYNVDICKPETFKVLDDYQFDAVVLCAALMPANVEKSNDVEDIVDYYNVNVIGTCNVLEYCRQHNIAKVISFGTRFDTKLYDEDTVINEETPMKFSYNDDHTTYVMSTVAKYNVLEYYNKKYGMKNIVFRLPAVIGVGPHGTYCKDGAYKKSGFQIFIERASLGEEIYVYGDPNTKKDMLYVKDLASAIVKAIKSNDAKGFYNIGYGKNFKLIDIVNAIVDVFSPENKKSNIVMRPDIPNNGGFSTMDTQKIVNEIGFAPAYSDIKDLIQDYRKELNRGVYTKLFKTED